jgi:hypothetical protein
MIEQLKKLQQPHIDEHLNITKQSYVKRKSLSTKEQQSLAQRQKYLTDFHIDPDLHPELQENTLSLVEQLENLKKINL